MLKKNKLKIIISSIAILLPMLFGLIMWKDLPNVMTTHWGADGTMDGTAGKGFVVFGVPCILLGLHLVCMLFTLLDKKQQEQNQKALGMIFWMVPAISLFVNGIMYRAAFGREFDVSLAMPVLFGIMFLCLGNYMPKIKQNKTLGIKISWTLHNEENWNKTHSLTGKVWVIGGLIVLFSICLPAEIMLAVTVCVIGLGVLIPFAYSYSIYKKHQKEGIVYTKHKKSGREKTVTGTSTVVLCVILIGVAVLMFTGSIEVSCNEDTLTIDASYWTDLEITYEEIDTVEYRKDLNVGSRTSGFGSPKLSMGIFRNDEFGSYTLYSFTGAEEYIVLTSGSRTLVIGMDEGKDTQAIYDALLEKAGNATIK